MTTGQLVMPRQLRPSALALIAANLVPVCGVLFLGWAVFPILLLFWMENVTVGVFNVLRMAAVAPNNPRALISKLFLIPFFTFHYGAFTVGHGVFVVGIFGSRAFMPEADAQFLSLHAVLRIVREYHLLYAALCLVASHGFSFVSNYIGKREYERVSLSALMGKPYARVFVLHVVIILGGFVVMAMNSSVPALMLLIVLKIGIDVGAHLREHKKLGQEPRTSRPTTAV